MNWTSLRGVMIEVEHSCGLLVCGQVGETEGDALARLLTIYRTMREAEREAAREAARPKPEPVVAEVEEAEVKARDGEVRGEGDQASGELGTGGSSGGTGRRPTSMLDDHGMIVGARMLRRRRFGSGSPSSDSDGRFKGGVMVGKPSDLQHILPLQVLSKAIRVMNH